MPSFKVLVEVLRAATMLASRALSALLVLAEAARALRLGGMTMTRAEEGMRRREALSFLVPTTLSSFARASWAAETEGATLDKIETTASGLRFQDFKVGTGAPPRRGQRVTIDYVMQTTGARYGSKIDSTKDRNEPFSFVLGDDADVIAGLQEAVATMRPGGLRRVFIPQSLGYTTADKRPVPPTFAVRDSPGS